MIAFVHIDKETEKTKNFSFIYKFITYPGEKEVAIITGEQIEKLRFMLNNADSGVENSESVYKIGEEIENMRGPLKGLHRELCYFEQDKPMIGVHIVF
jgi:hypothetical protein